MEKHETLAFTIYGDIPILYESNRTHSNEEWNAWLKFAREKVNIPGFNRGVLIYSQGTGPNAVQRKQAKKMMPRNDIPIAVVSDSIKVIPGIVTFFRWIKVTKIKFFKTNRLYEAFDYINVPKELRHGLIDAVVQLQIKLTKVFDNEDVIIKAG